MNPGKHRGPAEAMPDWQAGDVVRAHDGSVLVRRDFGTWACTATECPLDERYHGALVRGGWDAGTLRVLVLGGQAVAA
jgi:hypothetical protein